MPSPGIVIVLNGPSSVGKSSIQKEIQDSFEEPYLATGIDQLMLHMVPDRYLLQDVSDKKQVIWTETTKDAQGPPLHYLHFGPKGYCFLDGLHHTIRTLARCGNNVVVDYVALEEPWLPRLAGVLKGVRAYLIGVRAPLSVIEQRERSRPYPVGTARAHYGVVHKCGIYDIELDTSVQSVKECAEAVWESLATKPNAIRRLRELFENEASAVLE